MGTLRVLAVLLLAALGSVGTALAQYGNRYENMYGEPIDVTLDALVQMPEVYENRAIRTKGTLELLSNNLWHLGELGARVPIYPMREVAARFDADARTWIGKELEITGLVAHRQDESSYAVVPIIQFWAFLAPEEPSTEPRPPSPEATLEDLVTRLGDRDGDRVRVVGQFRGANLFGDLPSASRRRSADWVLKNDLFAVWVTGRKPQGSGFKLDPKLRRDSGKWLIVDGRVQTVNGVVYIAAAAVALTTPLTSAGAKDAPALPPPPLKPPVIVFSLPLDGERDIPANTVFHVQFCNDMEETSFKGRVGLRYAGRPRPGDRPLDAVRVSYDIGRRALSVDPGDQLRAGRVVELILLPGIVDLDGQPLEPRPDRDPGGAADVLRFQVGGAFLTGS